MWGLVWGDVFGVPIESWSASEIAAAYPHGYVALPSAYPADVPVKKRSRLRPLGIHSDDTQQSLALLNVCLSASGWSAAAWGRCLIDGDRMKAWRGTGKHFDNAVIKLAKGTPPQEAGSPSAGIGAAMRIAPLGALYRDQTRKLAEVALESSAMTHADLRSIALSYAVGWTCAQLVNARDVSAIRDELPDAVAEVEDEWLLGKTKWNIERDGRHQLSLGLARVLAAMTNDVRALGDVVVKHATRFVDKQYLPAHPNHAFALLGGIYGIACALADDVDPDTTVQAIVQQGEDTDTVAAIAGGLLGARCGTSWIPKERVLDRARIDLYAGALGKRTSGAPEPLSALLASEAALTAKEKAFQGETTWPR